MRAAEVTVSVHKFTDGELYYKINDNRFSIISKPCTFHQFAQESSDGEMIVVAIIELDDGSLKSVGLDSLRFTD